MTQLPAALPATGGGLAPVAWFGLAAIALGALLTAWRHRVRRPGQRPHRF